MFKTCCAFLLPRVSKGFGVSSCSWRGKITCWLRHHHLHQHHHHHQYHQHHAHNVLATHTVLSFRKVEAVDLERIPDNLRGWLRGAMGLVRTTLLTLLFFSLWLL